MTPKRLQSIFPVLQAVKHGRNCHNNGQYATLYNIHAGKVNYSSTIVYSLEHNMHINSNDGIMLPIHPIIFS